MYVCIVYCHCKAHSLNLAIGRACGEPLIRNMLTTVQTIAFAFDYSAKRLLAFQESLDQNVQVREEMDRRAKLRTLCETRWANRADAPSVQRSHSSFRCSRSCPGMAMYRKGATYALSSRLILLLLYAQLSTSSPTQLPCQLYVARK